MHHHLLTCSAVLILWFFRNVLSQSPVCFWNAIDDPDDQDGQKVNAMNGLYLYQGEHNGAPYYTTESCLIKYHMFYSSSKGAWHIHETETFQDSTDWAHCEAPVSNITSCSAWEIWDPSLLNFVSDSTLITQLDSCPSWTCDQVSIPSLSTPCNATFDVYLGNNTWSNSANNLYWFFNPLHFRWECADSYPDFCNVSLLAYTAQGWSDLYDATDSLSFEFPASTTHDVHCIVIPPSTPPTSAPSNNPSTPPTQVPSTSPSDTSTAPSNPPSAPPITTTETPSDLPTLSPVTHSPTYKPSRNPSVHSTPSPEHIVLNGTVINITVTISDSIAANDVVHSVNETLFTYLIANGIAPPLQTDIINRGTIIIATYGFSDVLDTDDMNSKEIESKISQDLEDEYQANAKVKVNVSSDKPDTDDTEEENNLMVIQAIAVFAFCVVAIIYFWYRQKKNAVVIVDENKAAPQDLELNENPRHDPELEENVSKDSMYDVAIAEPVITTAGETGGGFALISAEPKGIAAAFESSSSDSGKDDDLYIVKPTTGGNDDDDDDENENEDLNELYDKGNKTVKEEDTKGDEVELVARGEGVERDEDEDDDDDDGNDTDAIYEKPNGLSNTKGIATKK